MYPLSSIVNIIICHIIPCKNYKLLIVYVYSNIWIDNDRLVSVVCRYNERHDHHHNVHYRRRDYDPDSKVYGANIGPIWGR